MKNTIIEDKEFIILSLDVTNATKCKVINVCEEEFFEVELTTQEQYNDNDYVDFFTTIGSGIVFFTTKIMKKQNTRLKIEYPKSHKLIQRREYTRTDINKKILIQTEEGNIRATIKDISAGGMSLITNENMDENLSYKVDLNLEKNLIFSCNFKPVRVKLLEDNKYNVSGKFSLIKNLDRVSLSQYCLKKESEQQHK